MKQQQEFGTKWIAVAALALASASAFAAGPAIVKSGGGMVNEVQGRAAGASPGAQGKAIHIAGRTAVSEVSGRGSQIPNASPVRVDANATDVGHFGRGTAPMVKAKQPQGETLAQTR